MHRRAGNVISEASFGLWLRQRRKALGLTHAMLAERSHCSVSALRKLEQDVRQPSYRLAERLAANLKIEPAELAEFLAIARGERRVERLAGLSAVELPPLPRAPEVAHAPTAASAGVAQAAGEAFDPDLPSIAVLPFVNLSDDAANEHFADGLAEELLNVLAKMPGLRVASRTSAFSFKGNRDIDLPTLARRLGVAHVLEGSVRKAGPRVRITAQLIEAASDSHRWSQSYDRDLHDIFAVQDDIARSVVQALRATLLGEPASAQADAQLGAELRAATRGGTANPEAHELYLLARFLTDRLTAADNATAVGYYRRALQLDPDYALAWAGLAGAYSSQVDYGWAPHDTAVELARSAARHALALQPDLAEGHAELGWVEMTFLWDWAAADACYARALELNPGSRAIVGASSVLADSLGRKAQAVALARRAAALDPLSFIAHGNLALRCLNSGLLDEAATALDRALELNPGSGLLHTVLGTLRLEQQQPDDALAAFERETVPALRLLGRVMALHELGRHAERDAALSELIAVGADDGALQVAEAYAWLGDADNAFDWLERAWRQRDSGLAQLQSWPLLRNLHDDPRWLPFLERMGFSRTAPRPRG
jgi:TolB-like protein/Tfp pilus assembly protein PilF/DNA-binding XRE family transcriptional regulator